MNSAAGEVFEATPTSASLVSWRPHAPNDIVGHFILCTSGAYGVVVSNTDGFSPDISVDRWSSVKAPHGRADPPAQGESYVVWAPDVAAILAALSTRPAPTPDEWAAASAELAAHERRLR